MKWWFRMSYVLSIGNYNKNGKFESSEWKDLFLWLSKNVDFAYIYSFDLIQNYSYSINDGIQLLVFYKKDRLLADLHIEDYNNFVILYILENEVQDILKYIQGNSENSRICLHHKEDIDDLADDGSWQPLM